MYYNKHKSLCFVDSEIFKQENLKLKIPPFTDMQSAQPQTNVNKTTSSQNTI